MRWTHLKIDYLVIVFTLLLTVTGYADRKSGGLTKTNQAEPNGLRQNLSGQSPTDIIFPITSKPKAPGFCNSAICEFKKTPDGGAWDIPRNKIPAEKILAGTKKDESGTAKAKPNK